jgi:hypothetical protein
VRVRTWASPLAPDRAYAGAGSRGSLRRHGTSCASISDRARRLIRPTTSLRDTGCRVTLGRVVGADDLFGTSLQPDCFACVDDGADGLSQGARHVTDAEDRDDARGKASDPSKSSCFTGGCRLDDGIARGADHGRKAGGGSGEGQGGGSRVVEPQTRGDGDGARVGAVVASAENWCHSLMRKVLTTHTPFASHLASSLHAVVGRATSLGAASAELFPLPLPVLCVLAACGTSESARTSRHCGRQRRAAGLASALLVVICALNFVFLGERVQPDVLALRRQPSTHQSKMIGRLQLLLSSWCRPSVGFKPSGGRRGPQIQHLLLHAESLCAAGWSPPGGDLLTHEIPIRIPPGLGGPSSLDPSRLDFKSGLAHWELDRWLPDDLVVPFRDPEPVRRIDPDPRSWAWSGPGANSSRSLLEFYQKLDSANLLGFSRGDRQIHECMNPFNMYKDDTEDRLLCDRRGPNGTECRIVDNKATRNFPGYRFGELTLKRHCEGWRGSGTDRSDMYYQCEVTKARASTNVLGPPLTPSLIAAFPHLAAGLLPPVGGSSLKGPRTKTGDLDLLNRERAVPIYALQGSAVLRRKRRNYPGFKVFSLVSPGSPRLHFDVKFRSVHNSYTIDARMVCGCSIHKYISIYFIHIYIYI